ncbi:MAG: hypothetical protein PSV35_01610 [bacterium]|nr:hypothetical protein [bacterium]
MQDKLDNFLTPKIEQSAAQAPSSEAIKFRLLAEIEDYLGLPFPQYQQLRTALNSAIDEYNNAADSNSKNAALNKIQAAIDHVDLHSTPDVLVMSEGFHEIKNDLFTLIKKAFAENGVNTMLRAGKSDTPISRILSDMLPEKADALMEILHQGTSKMSDVQNETIQKNLANLYPDEDKSPEANQWRTFLTDHKIDYLGGENSRNYKVTNKNANDSHYGAIKILKIDNRLNMPRHIEQHVRQKHR